MKPLTREEVGKQQGAMVRFFYPTTFERGYGRLLAQSTVTHAHIIDDGGDTVAVEWGNVSRFDPSTSHGGTRLVNPTNPTRSRKLLPKGRDPKKILDDIAQGRKLLREAVQRAKVAMANLQNARSIMTSLSGELEAFRAALNAEIEG